MLLNFITAVLSIRMEISMMISVMVRVVFILYNDVTKCIIRSYKILGNKLNYSQFLCSVSPLHVEEKDLCNINSDRGVPQKWFVAILT